MHTPSGAPAAGNGAQPADLYKRPVAVAVHGFVNPKWIWRE